MEWEIDNPMGQWTWHVEVPLGINQPPVPMYPYGWQVSTTATINREACSSVSDPSKIRFSALGGSYLHVLNQGMDDELYVFLWAM